VTRFLEEETGPPVSLQSISAQLTDLMFETAWISTWKDVENRRVILEETIHSIQCFI
jgi:hypothetical protein